MASATNDVNFTKLFDSFVQQPINNIGVSSEYVSSQSNEIGFVIGLLIVGALFLFILSKIIHKKWFG